MAKLTLIANPGSSSRKYALYKDAEQIASINFELNQQGQVVYAGVSPQGSFSGQSSVGHIAFAVSDLLPVLEKQEALSVDDKIETVVLRIVAPSEDFQVHQKLTPAAIAKLRKLEPIAPLHIAGVLQEIELIGRYIPKTTMIGISDSAFHITIPAHNSAYAIPQKVAKSLGIKRYGYHGISVQSVARQLHDSKTLHRRVVVCHLGSGASITALQNGVSYQTSMGFSPLEGIMMATRSGSIDVGAAIALKKGLALTDDKLESYLQHSSGLLGVSGSSSDIRVLLDKERAGDEQAKLALDMYVSRVQQTIGQMVGALQGIDQLVFTGTVGERSVVMRQRIVHGLDYLGLTIDGVANKSVSASTAPELISVQRSSLPIFVVHSNETAEMLRQAHRFM